MSKTKKFILHFSQNNNNESIPNFVFDNLIELSGFTLAESNNNSFTKFFQLFQREILRHEM